MNNIPLFFPSGRKQKELFLDNPWWSSCLLSDLVNPQFWLSRYTSLFHFWIIGFLICCAKIKNFASSDYNSYWPHPTPKSKAALSCLFTFDAGFLSLLSWGKTEYIFLFFIVLCSSLFYLQARELILNQFKLQILTFCA